MKRSWLVVVALAACVGACDDGGGGDLASYCENYRSLADNNPFLTLDVASPGEIRTAFGDLHDAATAIESAAPDGLDRLASDYVEAIEAVDALLDAADFDPRNLDTAAYRRATIGYDEAATALSNETKAHCPIE